MKKSLIFPNFIGKINEGILKFEFTAHPGFNFIESFAKAFDLKALNNRIIIPPALGEGYVQKVDIDEGIKLMIHRHSFKEDFYLRRLTTDKESDLISIIFNSSEIPTDNIDKKEQLIQFLKTHDAAIQIASSGIGTKTFFPAHAETRFVVIGIEKRVLSSLLKVETPNHLVQTLLQKGSTFFFHEEMSEEEQRLFGQFFLINDQTILHDLSYRIKVEELLYLLFSRLLNRKSAIQYSINRMDVEKINSARLSIISDVSKQPKISELAKEVGMGETKMKQLFKQVFGQSIYNYYQMARMKEAAFLLKQAGFSVSETGYKLGFSNLSHFSRLFKRYYGTTPKQYTSDR